MSDIVKRLRAESKDWRENIGPMPLLDEAAEYIESLSGYARAKAAGLKVGAYWHDEKTGEDILLDNRVAEGIESLQAELAEERTQHGNLETGFKSFLTNHNKVLDENEALKAELAEARKTITRLEGQIAKLRRARR